MVSLFVVPLPLFFPAGHHYYKFRFEEDSLKYVGVEEEKQKTYVCNLLFVINCKSSHPAF